MRRRLIWLCLVLLLGCGAWFGKDAWELGQFLIALDEQEQLAKSRGPTLVDIALTCGNCHGQDGKSANPKYPRIAGLPAAYIEAQLNAFAEGRRQAPQMEPLAYSLTVQQRQALARYFAAR